MKWYLKVVKDNYANFNGRARRKEYWMFTLFNTIFIYGLAILSGILIAVTEVAALALIYVIYSLAILIPSLAVVVRRLHDTGKSGWYFLVILIPFIGTFWLLYLLITEGDKGPNEYGPDPKNENVEEIDQIGKVQLD